MAEEKRSLGVITKIVMTVACLVVAVVGVNFILFIRAYKHDAEEAMMAKAASFTAVADEAKALQSQSMRHGAVDVKGLKVLAVNFRETDAALRRFTEQQPLSLPILRGLADEVGTTVSLLVAEGDQQVAIAVIVPTQVSYQLSFHEGSCYPLDRGAAGIALLASMPPKPMQTAPAI